MACNSSTARRARLFRPSRDLWTQRTADKQRTIKRQRITIRDLSASRDSWKTYARHLKHQLADRPQPSAAPLPPALSERPLPEG